MLLLYIVFGLQFLFVVVSMRVSIYSILTIDGYYGVNNKVLVLNKYCKEKEICLEKVVYIGNDLNDLEVMKIVGLPIAPFDAYAEIKEISKYILKTKGGFGVVRELYTLILEKNKLLFI